MTRNSLVTLTGVVLVVGALWPSAAVAQVSSADPYLAETYSAAHPNDTALSARVRVVAKPKQADVYVDGYFAGVADDFNSSLQRLPVTPGGHDITLYLDGYRTITRHVSVESEATVTLRLKMDKLEPGQTSELPPPAVLSEGPGLR